MTTTTPFYKKALALFTRTQEAQIQKGLQKYPEPFNPFNWTPEELLNHALEETVDLTHYLVGLKEQLDAKDKEIMELRSLADKWERKAVGYELLYSKVSNKNAALDAKDKEIKHLEEQNSRWKDEAKRNIEEIISLKEELEKVKKVLVPDLSNLNKYDLNYDYVYKPVTGDPLSQHGPFVERIPKTTPHENSTKCHTCGNIIWPGEIRNFYESKSYCMDCHKAKTPPYFDADDQ